MAVHPCTRVRHVRCFWCGTATPAWPRNDGTSMHWPTPRVPRQTPTDVKPYELREAYDLLSRRYRLLLAEDDDEVRWSLTALFLNTGYEVHAVRDGAQFLDEFASVILGKPGNTPPDVIVTDVRMPGFSAMNIMAGLRDAGWTTPVMVISAFGDDALRARVERLGEATFFDKPLDMDALEVAVSTAAAHTRATGNQRRPPKNRNGG